MHEVQPNAAAAVAMIEPQQYQHQQHMNQPVVVCPPNPHVVKLRYLIDADGFQVDGKFLVKELAICDLFTRRISLYRFRVGKFNKLNDQNRKQVVWLRNNIHGLDFVDGPLDAPQDQVDQLIVVLCMEAHNNNELIGYKGGRYELDMLTRCGYAHLGFNIELLSCPRLDVLIDQNPNMTSIMCGQHRPLRRKMGSGVKVPHCPQMEVAYFMNYLMQLTAQNKYNKFYEKSDIYAGLVTKLNAPQPMTQTELSETLNHQQQVQQPQVQAVPTKPPRHQQQPQQAGKQSKPKKTKQSDQNIVPQMTTTPLTCGLVETTTL